VCVELIYYRVILDSSTIALLRLRDINSIQHYRKQWCQCRQHTTIPETVMSMQTTYNNTGNSDVNANNIQQYRKQWCQCRQHTTIPENSAVAIKHGKTVNHILHSTYYCFVEKI